jgi:arylsulfatase A-like enzyme
MTASRSAASEPPQTGPRRARNILFIMCDQLRRDYLGCYGHPTLKTPHIDALAASGTRFNRCYVQGTVCGPSRMSTYTGRYVASHGSTWNFVPLSVQIPTMGDYMRKAGLRTAVIGKTHVVGDSAGMNRLGIDPLSPPGLLLSQGGFEPYARHDGVVLDAGLKQRSYVYNDYLRRSGYQAANAWHEFANSGVDAAGQLQSGWKLRNSGLAARVEERHSETAWATDTAIDFIRAQGEAPWCLHLSYIKPHWPYIAPAPYHQAYGGDDIQPARRSLAERDDKHPVYRAFRNHAESQAFSRDEVRQAVIPSYMGLVKQLDDNLGRLIETLKAAGRLDDTLIVFTSDHGDLLGDHWLGEKEMFYEPSAGVPLIIVDPAAQLRGQVVDDLVEAIDLLPTFVEAVGAPADAQWLEGKSLLPHLRGQASGQREAAFSELDYAFYGARSALGLGVNQARAEMVCTDRWKLIRYAGFAPQLFDLQDDPQELVDLGLAPAHASVRAELLERLTDWHASRRQRTTMADAQVEDWTRHRTEPGGVEIGVW